jgi:hypothetical protein
MEISIRELEILKKDFLELNLKTQAPGKNFQAPCIFVPLLICNFYNEAQTLTLACQLNMNALTHNPFETEMRAKKCNAAQSVLVLGLCKMLLICNNFWGIPLFHNSVSNGHTII